MNEIKIGDDAPDFSALDQDGNILSLKQFRGKKLLLYFYPKDDTPGCTAESCNLRDNYDKFLHEGYQILGVSADSQASHKKFIEKFAHPFHHISDTDKIVIKKYQAWGEKNLYGKKYMGIFRKTFIISEKGIIENIFEKVQTKEHSKQIFEV